MYSPRCEKCGGDNVLFTYFNKFDTVSTYDCARMTPIFFKEKTGAFWQYMEATEEHFQNKCGRCGYRWASLLGGE